MRDENCRRPNLAVKRYIVHESGTAILFESENPTEWTDVEPDAAWLETAHTRRCL
jgi:hypothetical protein